MGEKNEKEELKNCIPEELKNCIPDGIVIVGGGIFIGGVVSILTLQSWPILFGLGIGLGLAYDYCDRQCTNPFDLRKKENEEK